MLPRALLFSSDEQTSTVLHQALSSLGLEVTRSREIFAAVEELTRRNFQTILIDWTQELEASFLLNMTRELKSTRNAHCVVIVDASVAASLTVNPDAFLVKPFTIEQAREAVFDSQELKASVPNSSQPISGRSELTLLPRSRANCLENGSTTIVPPHNLAVSSKRTEPYPIPDIEALHEKIHRASLASGLQPALVKHGTSAGKKTLALFCLLFLLAAVVHGEQQLGFLPGGLATYRDFLLSPTDQPPNSGDQDTLSSSFGIGGNLESDSHFPRNTYGRNSSGEIAVRPIFRDGYSSQSKITLDIAKANRAESILTPEQAVEPTGSNPLIPPSLHLSPVRIPMFQSAVRSAFTAANWPAGAISVPEETSRLLLIHQVAPHYPLEALRAGLQGPVVFQALVGRDGSIQDLKLVNGYFALGLAAVDAVKQWRFRPYRLNGEFVEMQTYLTVNFPAGTNDAPNQNGSLVTYGVWK